MKKTIPSITATLSALFLLLLAYLSCGGAKSTPADPPIAVAGLTLNRNSMTLAVGDATGTLIPAISPQNVTNKKVAWSSSDNAIATVNANGVVTPNSVGTATITAMTQNGGKTANCLIKVVDAPKLAERAYLNRNELSITVGGSGSFALNFIPSTATDQNVTWESSNTAVATVDAKNGFVTARAEGEATITAKYNQQGGAGPISGPIYDINDSKVLAPPPAAISATVKVGSKSKSVPATGIKVGEDQQYVELSVDGSGLLLPTVLPANATNTNVSFSSSAPNIASVSSLGLMTGRVVGAAVITATTEDGGYTAQTVVRVVSDRVDPVGVSLNKAAIELGDIGKTEQLTATVSPSNATDKSLYWYSSDLSVAAVDMNGIVQARGAGVAIVTAKTQVDGGHTAICHVTVTGTSVPVTGVTLNKTSATVSIGGTETLTATIAPSNATNKAVTWTSNDPAIATVNAGTVRGVAAGSATITATTEDGSKTATCAVTVTNSVPVTGVTLNKTSASVVVGGTETLTATIAPSNATNKNVTWTSSNDAIATVSDGIVTGVAAGSATITATTEDGSKTATCAVTVTNSVPVTGVTLNKTSASVVVGGAETLTATIAPTNATNKNVTWVSSDPSIATVSPSTPTTSGGTVTGVKAGTATITVTTEDGNKTATCTVTVTNNVPVTGVTLNKTSASIVVGGTETLTATIAPADATNKNVTWASNDPAIATVNAGTVRGVAAGSATITVTTQDGSKTATCTVTVTSTGVAVANISLDKTSATVSVGGTETLTATVQPANATNQNVTWASNNNAVATVSNGTVTGVAAGTAIITATTQDGSKTATCDVTVQNGSIPVTGVILGPSTSTSISIGGTILLTATVQPTNATNKNITWVSSNASIATVSNGTVTGVAAGTATIIVATQDANKTATCVVNVVVPVTGVSLNKRTTSISVNGGTETLTATIAPANATNKNVTWSTSDASIGTVSNGTVTGVAAGTATITATTQDGSKTDTCVVTVAKIPVTSVSLSKTSATVSVGGTDTLTATVAPANATDKDVTWFSSNDTIATVSSGGLVTGVAAGTATIIVLTKDGGKTATCAVTVPVPVTGVTMSDASATINVGATKALTATIAPTNAANKNVNWSSSDAGIATVSNGTVKGVARGTATITATATDTTNGTKTDTCTVTVNQQVTDVLLDKSKTSISVGGTAETLTATIVPANANDQAVTWTSSNTGVATVSGSGLTATVTAVAAGTTTITVKTNDGNKTKTCAVTVVATSTAVTGVTLKSSTTISHGGTETLTATIAPTNATNQNVTWSTSAAGVATVSIGGLVTGVAPGTATITATAADTTNGTKTATCNVTVNKVSVASVSLDKTSATVSLNGTETLTATVLPATATDKDVTWVSSNTGIATVSGGTVTGVAAGTATIMALTKDGGKTATCTVTVVVAVTGVTLAPTSATISVHGTILLTATVLPATATNQNVTWSSSDTTIATVSNGTVTGVKAGPATITATTADGNKTATCTVTVQSDAIPVTGVSLNKNSTTINFGTPETFTATIAPASATNKNVTWFSSNTAIATVNNGTVTGVAAGSTAIFVVTQDGGMTATCTVTVEVPVTGVSLNKTSTTVSLNGTETLAYTIAPANATNKNVTWSSSDTGIATVSNGTVTGVAAGTATITATTQNGNKTATCVVTVSNTNFPVTGVSLNKTSTTVSVGGTDTLTATFEPANATNKNVTWISSNTAIATVSNGTVTGVAVGSTTITVVTQDGSKTATCTVTVNGP